MSHLPHMLWLSLEINWSILSALPTPPPPDQQQALIDWLASGWPQAAVKNTQQGPGDS